MPTKFRVEIARSAERDIEEIWTYIATDSPAQASAFMANRTTLVIAHRLSTVVTADCIVVMEKGRILEIGRHEELMQKDGPYRRVYQMQFACDPSRP